MPFERFWVEEVLKRTQRRCIALCILTYHSSPDKVTALIENGQSASQFKFRNNKLTIALRGRMPIRKPRVTRRRRLQRPKQIPNIQRQAQ
jgi:hypothetical protein